MVTFFTLFLSDTCDGRQKRPGKRSQNLFSGLCPSLDKGLFQDEKRFPVLLPEKRFGMPAGYGKSTLSVPAGFGNGKDFLYRSGTPFGQTETVHMVLFFNGIVC